MEVDRYPVVSPMHPWVNPTLLNEAVIPEAEKPLVKTEASDAHALGSGSCNSLKSFNGQYYSGMVVGGSHTWNYDGGVWHEVKTEPDLWKIKLRSLHMICGRIRAGLSRRWRNSASTKKLAVRARPILLKRLLVGVMAKRLTGGICSIFLFHRVYRGRNE
ncbi:uncharacterized protein G6M90_00g111760 [Metarhizium brunneum]|uniref:Uncharacterized protein n=1 Tax=Metarhizium brunneum TaxID=500148 RepID=A0A7D5YZ70_9HYPO